MLVSFIICRFGLTVQVIKSYFSFFIATGQLLFLEGPEVDLTRPCQTFLCIIALSTKLAFMGTQISPSMHSSRPDSSLMGWGDSSSSPVGPNTSRVQAAAYSFFDSIPLSALFCCCWDLLHQYWDQCPHIPHSWESPEYSAFVNCSLAGIFQSTNWSWSDWPIESCIAFGVD